MNDVVITGISLASPIGMTLKEFSQQLFEGVSGIKELSSDFPKESFPIHCAGFLSQNIYPPMRLGSHRQETELLIKHLLNDYMENTKKWLPIDGLIYGSNSGLPRYEEILQFQKKGEIDLERLKPEYGALYALSHLAKYDQMNLDPQEIISGANGCITGLVALSYAYQRIKLGRNKRIMVICDEARIRPEDLLKYNALGVLSRAKDAPEKVSCPFSKSRSGFVKGEGAGMMIIESLASAEKMGIEPLGKIMGFSQSSDAWRLTEGREDQKGMVEAMKTAIEKAGLNPEQIDFISAHGTSTIKNDYLETAAIKKTFGKRAYHIPISSLKSQMGHLNYACGIVEVASCLMMIKNQRVAPTINYTECDPLCDLDYVPNQSRPHKIKYILKNNYGFGGANASMILGAIQ